MGMIIVKLAIITSVAAPRLRLKQGKQETFLFYTTLVPLIFYLFLFSEKETQYYTFNIGDALSLMLLALWIPTIYASFSRDFWDKYKIYCQLLSLLVLFIFFIFVSHNLISLFVFFELSLIPIILILFIGGKSKKKLEAGFFIFVFTSLSAFMLLALLIIICLHHPLSISLSTSFVSTFYRTFHLRFICIPPNHLIYNLITLVLLVKSPLFLVHIWLPKAHVEAPVFGSMILASLLLKTGGYGYLVFLLKPVDL